MTSITSRAVAVFTLLALALTGCTAPPAPEPTVIAMSVEEAGQYYLDTVCPANAVGEALAAAYTAQDLDAFRGAAADARDTYKESATRFGAEDVVWPADVEADVIVLRDASIAIAASYETLSTIESLDAAAEVQFPSSDDSAAASARIRDALGLSSDAAVSCG